MPHQTFLGFDYGTKRIGIAVGQSISKTANPLEQLEAEPEANLWQAIDRVVKTWRPNAFVVGKPVNMDDSNSAISEKAEAFAKKLKEHYGLPIFMMDERLSTQAAKTSLNLKNPKKKSKKAAINSTAAQIILQDYLDLL